MEIEIYFDEQQLFGLIHLLRQLPRHTPLSFGQHEEPHHSDVEISEFLSCQAFYHENKTGFFLHGKSCNYDFILGHQKPAKLTIFIKDADTPLQWAIDLLSTIQPLQVECAYCCSADEYEHRNRLIVESDNGRIESWIGRDLNQYISGLYCVTYLSRHQITEKNLNVSVILANALSHLQFDDGSYLLVFFDDIHNWQAYAPKLDKLCMELEGIFSRVAVDAEASSTNGFWQLQTLLRKWK